eukprot:82546-Chlamydomonas_euryale.AAC.2
MARVDAQYFYSPASALALALRSRHVWNATHQHTHNSAQKHIHSFLPPPSSPCLAAPYPSNQHLAPYACRHDDSTSCDDRKRVVLAGMQEYGCMCARACALAQAHVPCTCHAHVTHIPVCMQALPCRRWTMLTDKC